MDHPIFTEEDLKIFELPFTMSKQHALDYGSWLIKNCIIARDGFRIGTSNWSKVISNEEAYEMYLESLKNGK